MSVHRGSDTLTYLKSRERVLGGRMVLHQDPEISVPLLVAALGGRQAAWQWLADVIDLLEDGGRAA